MRGGLKRCIGLTDENSDPAAILILVLRPREPIDNIDAVCKELTLT